MYIIFIDLKERCGALLRTTRAVESRASKTESSRSKPGAPAGAPITPRAAPNLQAADDSLIPRISPKGFAIPRNRLS